MNIDRQKLKRLAEVATQGEWSHERFGVIQAGPVIQFANGSGRQQIAMATGTDWMAQGEQIANAEFMAAANPSVVLALLAEIDRLEDALHGASSEVHGLHVQHGRNSSELRRTCQARDDARKERDQLKAENEALRKDLELLAIGRAKLAGAMSRLRSKHNDWTAPEALPAAELVWCACGDGFPPNSYGSGFMDANNGVCWSCDAAKAVSHD